jgi:hypothetical protein
MVQPTRWRRGARAVTEDLTLAMPSGAVPHYGPVSPDCPVECLRAVLSTGSFNPLARACDAPFDPPGTVGDVLGLYSRGQLREIRGLGRRRISEIGAALVLAGFDITAAPKHPQDASEPGKAARQP